VGRDSSVGIATGYGLDGPGIDSWWGRDFLHQSRSTLGLTQPPTQMGIGSFSGVKQPGLGVDHPPLSSTEVKERVKLYLCTPFGFSWPVLGRILRIQSVTSGSSVRHFFVRKVRCEFVICRVSFLHSALNPSRPARNLCTEFLLFIIFCLVQKLTAPGY
jgi:hypothetical protein